MRFPAVALESRPWDKSTHECQKQCLNMHAIEGKKKSRLAPQETGAVAGGALELEMDQ